MILLLFVVLLVLICTILFWMIVTIMILVHLKTGFIVIVFILLVVMFLLVLMVRLRFTIVRFFRRYHVLPFGHKRLRSDTHFAIVLSETVYRAPDSGVLQMLYRNRKTVQLADAMSEPCLIVE